MIKKQIPERSHPRRIDYLIKNKGITVSLNMKTKKQYYGFLNVYPIPDNKKFWRAVKPSSSNKIVATNKVMLRDGRKFTSDTGMVADTVNKFFMDKGNTLKIDKDQLFLVETKDVFNPVFKSN